MVCEEPPAQLSHIRFPPGAAGKLADIPQPPHGEQVWWGPLAGIVAKEARREWYSYLGVGR